MIDAPKKRGLAALSPERRREISAMGGKASPGLGRFATGDERTVSCAAKGGRKSRRPVKKTLTEAE